MKPTVTVTAQAVRVELLHAAVLLDPTAARQLGLEILRAAAEADRAILRRKHAEAACAASGGCTVTVTSVRGARAGEGSLAGGGRVGQISTISTFWNRMPGVSENPRFGKIAKR